MEAWKEEHPSPWLLAGSRALSPFACSLLHVPSGQGGEGDGQALGIYIGVILVWLHVVLVALVAKGSG